MVSKPKNTGLAAKKAELDALKNQVQKAEQAADQAKAVVEALSQKSAEYSNVLATANSNRESALANKNQVDQVVNQATYLNENMSKAQAQTQKAHDTILTLAQTMTDILRQLIYGVGMIKRLSVMIHQKKNMNPLIPEDLINQIASTVKEANAAVAATLKAIQICYASNAVARESWDLTQLENQQMGKLLNILVGGSLHYPKSQSFQGLLTRKCDKAGIEVQNALQAKDRATVQLNQAQGNLDVAKLTLSSLKAGLAAANAAAMAT